MFTEFRDTVELLSDLGFAPCTWVEAKAIADSPESEIGIVVLVGGKVLDLIYRHLHDGPIGGLVCWWENVSHLATLGSEKCPEMEGAQGENRTVRLPQWECVQDYLGVLFSEEQRQDYMPGLHVRDLQAVALMKHRWDD